MFALQSESSVTPVNLGLVYCTIIIVIIIIIIIINPCCFSLLIVFNTYLKVR